MSRRSPNPPPSSLMISCALSRCLRLAAAALMRSKRRTVDKMRGRDASVDCIGYSIVLVITDTTRREGDQKAPPPTLQTISNRPTNTINALNNHPIGLRHSWSELGVLNAVNHLCFWLHRRWKWANFVWASGATARHQSNEIALPNYKRIWALMSMQLGNFFVWWLCCNSFRNHIKTIVLGWHLM